MRSRGINPKAYRAPNGEETSEPQVTTPSPTPDVLGNQTLELQGFGGDAEMKGAYRTGNSG